MQHLLISTSNKLQTTQEDILLTCNRNSLTVVSYQDTQLLGTLPLMHASRLLRNFLAGFGIFHPLSPYLIRTFKAAGINCWWRWGTGDQTTAYKCYTSLLSEDWMCKMDRRV